ncbi:MAG: lysophospholipid acyltransferase family protein [Bacteroidota bacterium]
MKKIIGKLYLYKALAAFVLVMLILGPFIVLPYIFGKRFGARFSYPVMRIWALSFVFPIAGTRFRVRGQKHIRKGEVYVYVANHNSLLDSVALVHAIPFPMKPLAKAEMARIPLFGFVYRFMTIMVDRNNAESRRRSLLQMKDCLANGVSVTIFPEGRMNTGTEAMLPFYDGAFHLAIETGTPILPVVLQGTRALLPPDKNLKLSSGTIDIQILTPINTTGMQTSDSGRLKSITRDLMLAVCTQHSE